MENSRKIATSLPIRVFLKPEDDLTAPWTPFEYGPGYITIPEGYIASVEIQNIDDYILKTLVDEISSCRAIYELNLSENRKIGNKGIRYLPALDQITSLNLSAVGLNDYGIEPLLTMKNIRFLDISYCTRITDMGLKKFGEMRNLEDLYIRGIPKITHAAVKWIERHDLTIRE